MKQRGEPFTRFRGDLHLKFLERGLEARVGTTIGARQVEHLGRGSAQQREKVESAQRGLRLLAEAVAEDIDAAVFLCVDRGRADADARGQRQRLLLAKPRAALNDGVDEHERCEVQALGAELGGDRRSQFQADDPDGVDTGEALRRVDRQRHRALPPCDDIAVFRIARIAGADEVDAQHGVPFMRQPIGQSRHRPVRAHVVVAGGAEQHERAAVRRCRRMPPRERRLFAVAQVRGRRAHGATPR